MTIRADQLPTVLNRDGSAEYAIEQPFEGVLKMDAAGTWSGEEFDWREGEDEPRVVRTLGPVDALTLACTLKLMVVRRK